VAPTVRHVLRVLDSFIGASLRRASASTARSKLNPFVMNVKGAAAYGHGCRVSPFMIGVFPEVQPTD